MNKTTSIKHFVASHTLSSVYRGSLIPLATVPFDRAIQYRIYELLNEKMNPFGSAIVCGSVSAIFNLPFSLLSNNYILDEKQKSVHQYCLSLVKSKNPSFLLSGIKPELARSLLSTTIFLGVYGNMRQNYGNSNTQCVINSVTASVALWTVTYPLDTLKVSQQTDGNKNVVEIIRTRIKLHGVFNMWRGILPVLVRTIPSSAFGMLAYEKTKNLVEKIKNDQ